MKEEMPVLSGFFAYYRERENEKKKIKDIITGKVDGTVVDLGHVMQIIYPSGERFTCNSIDYEEYQMMLKKGDSEDVCEE